MRENWVRRGLGLHIFSQIIILRLSSYLYLVASLGQIFQFVPRDFRQNLGLWCI